MNRLLSLREIKGLAREQLRGHYLLLIAAFLICRSILSLPEFMTQHFLGADVLWQNIMYYIIILLISLLSAILNYGMAILYMGIIRRRDVSLGSLLDGFRAHADKTILVYAIPVVIDFACSLPAALYSLKLDDYGLLEAVVKVAPRAMLGTLMSFLLSLPFAYVFFLLCDYPNADVSQILKESLRMFKKRPGMLLLLYISFIPLYILGSLSFGIGNLWVNCYLQMSLTVLYDDLLPKKKTPLVALTFDDGPNTSTTPKVLDCLSQYGVVASFFLIGDHITPESTPVVKRAMDMGCEIDNHSRSHPAMTDLSPEEMKAQIEYTDARIFEITGKVPSFFRPPYIAVNDEMYEQIHKIFICGLGCDDWNDEVSVDTRVNKITQEVKDGNIILLHDMEGNDKTVEALHRIIPILQERGYRFVTVSELFRLKGVSPQKGVLYSIVDNS